MVKFCESFVSLAFGGGGRVQRPSFSQYRKGVDTLGTLYFGAIAGTTIGQVLIESCALGCPVYGDTLSVQ